MKYFLNTIAILFANFTVFGQAEKIITDVIAAQSTVKTITYSLVRTDTLVTNDTRIMTGRAWMQSNPADTLFGFNFKGEKDGDNNEVLYNGSVGLITNPKDKTYRIINNGSSIRNLLFNGGGQMIMPDILKLDSSRSYRISSTEDDRYYYLTFYYSDLKEYNVINRKKIIGIDKQTLLPVTARFHQETDGRVQDLFYQAKDITINSPELHYDFTGLAFLSDYKQTIAKEDFTTISTGIQAPDFSLHTLTRKMISSNALIGKVVLLDFWEVWCEPCIQSIPQVNVLYNNYKNKGLMVYGVVNDLRQLEPAKNFIKRKGIAFETLIGNEQLKKDYKLGAIPLYILINKKGKIEFVSIGYTGELENAIIAALEK